MVKGFRPPSQSWKTFIQNHASGIAAMDFLVVPTIGFRLLYALVILKQDRRQILPVNVTGHPTAEWVAPQIMDAFPWDSAPLYMIRDRDAIYGNAVIRCLRAAGIRDRPTTPRSPWQNGYVERLIGSIRRECLDHLIVFGEAHLRRTPRTYMTYYNAAHTHLSLGKDAPYLSTGPTIRPDHISSDPWWPPSPILSGLVSGKDKGLDDPGCFAHAPLRRDRVPAPFGALNVIRLTPPWRCDNGKTPTCRSCHAPCRAVRRLRPATASCGTPTGRRPLSPRPADSGGARLCSPTSLVPAPRADV
jgi:hypothetical protein